MKKILIALPLVLIMILTMIPVMAEEAVCKDVKVKATFVITVNQQPNDKPMDSVTITKMLTWDVASDAKKIEAEAIALGNAQPKPEVAEGVKWEVIVKNVEPVEDAENADNCPTELAKEVEVTVDPSCKTPEGKPTDCPKVCDVINVVGIDVITGAEIAGKGYGVLPNQAPKFQYMLDDFSKTEIPANYRIVSNWFGQDWIDFPALLNSDCTIKVKLIPIRQKVTVIHELYDCCEELDGTNNYRLWKSFVEQGTSVDFIDYHSKLLVDKTRAKEFALTRLERVNAQDFVFQDAFFDDGVRLGGYLTGEIFDLDGNKIAGVKLEDKEPTIRLVYYHTNCVEKAEEKVDNAQVNAGNATTNTPVTQQLPATGAKDVTAFFMSAVALLGLGIFFAKKH